MSVIRFEEMSVAAMAWGRELTPEGSDAFIRNEVSKEGFNRIDRGSLFAIITGISNAKSEQRSNTYQILDALERVEKAVKRPAKGLPVMIAVLPVTEISLHQRDADGIFCQASTGGAPVTGSKLSRRARAVLQRLGATTAQQLSAHQEYEVIRIKNCGSTTIRELRRWLASVNLCFRGSE